MRMGKSGWQKGGESIRIYFLFSGYMYLNPENASETSAPVQPRWLDTIPFNCPCCLSFNEAGHALCEPCLLAELMAKVSFSESKLDLEKDIYLFTWSIREDEFPDLPFNKQHRYYAGLVVNFLSYQQCGAACVEVNQRGLPHYHGWYQLSDDPINQQLATCVTKVMIRYAPAGFKVTLSKGHVKIASWSHRSNCLWYYKKDAPTRMLRTPYSYLQQHTKVPDISQYDQRYGWLKSGKRQSVADLEEQISLRDFYMNFYRD